MIDPLQECILRMNRGSATLKSALYASYAAVLGGVDLLVFVGGIGEHAPIVRERICAILEFLSVQLDAPSNEANAELISSPESTVRVRVVKTNEDLMIVRHVRSTLAW